MTDDRPPGGRAARAAAQRGFTVLELAIASTLLLLGIVLASGLLMRSQLMAEKLTSELRNPQPRYAAVRLRRDLEGAQAISPVPPGWQSGRMTLVTSNGFTLGWELDGTTLRRVQLAGPGGESVHQALLYDVVSWRWRRSAARLIDVELRFHTRDGSGVVLSGVARTWVSRPRERRQLLRVALRGGAGAGP